MEPTFIFCAVCDTICRLCYAGNLHRQTQLYAAVSVTVAVSCYTDMAVHVSQILVPVDLALVLYGLSEQ